jgi:hypothetical protein
MPPQRGAAPLRTKRASQGATVRAKSLTDSVVAAGAGLAVAVLYLFTLSGNHSENEDSLEYVIRIHHAPHSEFFEGPHIAFDWVGWVVFEAVRATGITDDPLRSIQVFDALLAAATVGLLTWILLTGGVRPAGALVACGIVAFSYGFWRNSVEVEVYTLSAFFLVGSFGAAWYAVRRPSARTFALLGLLNGLAVLAHLTNVLFAPVAFAAVLLARDGRGLRSLIRWLGTYVGAATAVTVPAYATAAAVLRLDSPAQFWRWLTRETKGGTYGRVDLGAVKDAVVGSGRALVGAHSALAIGSISTFVHEHFPSKPLREEAYFLRGFDTSVAVALLVLTAIVGLLVVVLAASWLSKRTRPDERIRTAALLSAAWLVPFAAFYAFWDPLNIELWYVVWLPVAILLALPLTAGRGPGIRTAAAIALVAGLLVVNLFGSQLPQRANAKDYWRVRAQWYRTHARQGDLVLSYNYIWSTYLAYLTPAHVVDVQRLFIDLPRPAAAKAALRLAEATHARHVYVSDYLFDPYPGDPQACNDGMGTCADAAALRRLLQPHCRLLARTSLERVWIFRRT